MAREFAASYAAATKFMDDGLANTIWTICYFVVLLGFSFYGIHRYIIVYYFLKHRNDHPEPKAFFDELPTVTVQLPMFNERYVVERLLNSVSQLDYPKDRLEIQVLDDSTDDTKELVQAHVLRLREQGFDIQFIHRTNRSGFKAGALAEGLKRCKGEYVLILDADFVAGPDLLKKTVHFFTDEKIGMVQTRWGHINRGYSMLTRVQAMFLDGHLLLEQTARSRSGRFINFNGTAGLWRKTCIDESGGWQADTLTEDLDLSYRAQLGGWKFVFLRDLVTPAELPVDMNGFKSQQHRWTKGSVQTCKKILPRVWKDPNISLPVKIEATFHLTSNFSYLLLAFLCVLLHPRSDGGGTSGGWTRMLLIDLPIFLAASVSVGVFHAVAQRHLRPKGWIKEMMLFPGLLALGIGLSINNAKAVLEAVFNHESPFNRTPKYGIERKSQDWRSAVYVPLKSMMPLVELGFALYFTHFVVHEIVVGNWLTVPFLLLFQFGFAFVAISSILQNFNIRWGQNASVPDSNEAVPA